jgi:PncC family amidohydrolase
MDEPLEVYIGNLLRQRGWHLAVAESCTGGLVGHRITNVPGSSDYFLGGIISYSNEAKMRLLGVHPKTLQEYGAVSRETVIEMARGARRQLGAEVAIAVSGIAGPGGGTSEKPVGLIWIGLSAHNGDEAWRFIWQGNRQQIKEQSAEKALELLINYLGGNHGP